MKCRNCGVPTEYSRIGQKLVVVDVETQARHVCEGNRSQADISEAIGLATGKLAIEVSEAVKKLGRDAQTIKLEAISDLQDKIASIATETVKSLVPVEHVITIEKYDGSKVESTGRPHMLLQELVELCQLRMHTFLVGPAGSGKTTAVEQAANILELPYYSWSMGPSTSEWDLFGYRSPDGHYVPGILREPFETGGILCLDEMDNTNPNVLTALNSALANGHAQFPDGRVAKHPDFVCVAGGNTYGRGANRVYVGRMQLDGATLDRFGVINWDYDEEAEVDWAGRDQMTWVAHVQRIRHKAEQLGVRYIFSPRASINGAKMIRNGLAWERAEAVWLWKGIPEEDRSRLCE